MSLPYESNVTDWGKIRCIKAWIEYPFADDGDTTSKLYRMLCMCKNAAYEAPAFSAVMSSATVAKIVELPFAADATAYFVGDSEFTAGEGGTIQFVREFAPVPAARSRASGTYSAKFPAFRKWSEVNGTGRNAGEAQDQLNQDEANDSPPETCYYRYTQRTLDGLSYDGLPIFPPREEIRAAKNETTYAKITYTYVYATDQASVTPDAPWIPTHYGIDTSTPLTAGCFGDFLGEPTGSNLNNPQQPAENDVEPYLYDSSSLTYTTTPAWTTDKSVPSKTEYVNDYIDQIYLNVESQILPWKGNIFVKETISVLAK